MTIDGLDTLVASDEERRGHLVGVLVGAFERLIADDELAFRRKFRKMAADPFAFYRGTAPLFYADVSTLEDPWVDDDTARVWIQGDLHAENYGTYMDAAGVLVFDVNDFDEAYLGHYTWDLQRMAASIALLGYAKALSDATVTGLVEAYARAYLAQVETFASSEGDTEFRLTLDTTEGAVRNVLLVARAETRIGLLERMTSIEEGERVFAEGAPGLRRLEADERERVLAGYEGYLDTIPEAKRQQSISYRVKDVVGASGFGIGSAGLKAYNLLVEGRSQALENDVILSMKEGQTPAASRVVEDAKLRDYFQHEGHRTAVSQQALQAHADPWVGWCSLDGVGQVIKELSPYEADLDWGDVTEPEEMRDLVGQLGRATAKIHCVSDEGSEHTLVDVQVEEAIMAVVDGRHDAFVEELAAFGAAYGALTREDHRRFVDAFRNGEIEGLPAD